MKQVHFFILWFFVLNLYSIKAQAGCRTPNGENARCVPINNCKILYDSVLTSDPEVIRFLRASQCGYNGQPLVCCGSSASYQPPPTSASIRDRRPELLPKDCGNQVEADKILNGDDTVPEEFPWTAMIGYKNSSNFEQFACGGSLINNRYIVTAAHCVAGRVLRVVGALNKVRLGEWNTATDPDCYGAVRVCVPDKPIDLGIEETIQHPDYVDGSKDRYHDIALIRLNRQVEFTNYIRPVCLPQPNEEVQVGQRLTVVGWGRTETGQYSTIKQKLAVPVVHAEQCAKTFGAAGVRVRSSQLCAGGEKAKDSCGGDSGGPLLAERANQQFFLEGLVSFGATCGTEGWPGIYTKVGKYRDWIEGNIRP